jgi:hypothetical protein
MADSVTVFDINGVEYNVIKRGLPQANQVADLGRWLAVHGVGAYRAVESEGNVAGGLEMVAAVLATLSGDALVELYALVFGCTIEVSREFFDVAQAVDGVMALYDNSPAIKRLVGRFFSVSASPAAQAATSTQ